VSASFITNYILLQKREKAQIFLDFFDKLKAASFLAAFLVLR